MERSERRGSGEVGRRDLDLMEGDLNQVDTNPSVGRRSHGEGDGGGTAVVGVWVWALGADLSLSGVGVEGLGLVEHDFLDV